MYCPNCNNGDMESNDYDVDARKDVTHTCSECGYCETR